MILLYARALVRAQRRNLESNDCIEPIKSRFVAALRDSRLSESQQVLCAGLVLTDLVSQRWILRCGKASIEVARPIEVVGDQAAEKARIRAQELLKRDAQLRQPAVRTFIRSMEKPRLHDGRFVSIFTLMRDGRELARTLKDVAGHMNNGWADALAKTVDPYLEFVTSEKANCKTTGLRLMDVWRYFRHTWSNQHASVPGRGMLFLVRDRAAPDHPVMGIGALSSPIVQLRRRDLWIGWHPDRFVREVRERPTEEIAKWLVRTIDRAVADLYVDDFIEDRVLTARQVAKPTEAVISALLRDGAKQRRLHHRFARARDLKATEHDSTDEKFWINRARTHLFRSKRALTLGSLLRARLLLAKSFGETPSKEKLVELMSSGVGADVVRLVLKKAKADRIGIAVADISVCGAVQPYNAILGGKLVAMLAASPEVAVEYRRRYRHARSEIASAMAGRPIIRASDLVLFGTTSLYGIGSSQYNRIKIPCDRIGGAIGQALSYEELGHSEAFGTSHYSDDTVDALVTLVQQSAEGQRVNSIFGEGVSPKLRKVRSGLDLLGLSSAALLRHHRRRVIYGISLVSNLQRYLIGMDERPKYLVPLGDSEKTTSMISAWWRERWLKNRILSDDVLEQVSQHSLVRPVRHGARVQLPPDSDVSRPMELLERT